MVGVTQHGELLPEASEAVYVYLHGCCACLAICAGGKRISVGVYAHRASVVMAERVAAYAVDATNVALVLNRPGAEQRVPYVPA